MQNRGLDTEHAISAITKGKKLDAKSLSNLDLSRLSRNKLKFYETICFILN